MPVFLAAPTARGNPLQRLLYAQLPASGFTVRYRNGFPRDQDLARADVVHVGWPDRATGRRVSAWRLERRLARRLASIEAARARGTRVVFTLHNAVPRHLEQRALLAEFTASLLRTADVVHVFDRRHVRVAQELAGPAELKVRVVPHPVYPVPSARSSDERRARDPSRSIRVAALGWLRPDKRIRQLADLVAEVSRQEAIAAELVVGGSPPLSWAGMVEGLRIVAHSLTGGGLSVRPWRHSDRALARLMSGCDIAILGNAEALNSGSVFLALSLGLQVVAPERSIPEALLGHPRIGSFRHADEFLAALAGQLRAAADRRVLPNYGPCLERHRSEIVAADFRHLVAEILG